jgi:hypothetical protein
MPKRASLIKRKSDKIRRPRSTKAQMEGMYADIERTLEGEHPVTLRRLYYLLIGQGLEWIRKQEKDYDRVGEYLKTLRKCGRVPWNWVVDNSRRLRVPNTFTSIGEALEVIANIYRRDPWADQNCLFICITEKDAMGALLWEETRKDVVPLAIIRGGCSWTFLHELAEKIEAAQKPVYIYYLGDHDAAGLDVEGAAEEFIREYAPSAEITGSGSPCGGSRSRSTT